MEEGMDLGDLQQRLKKLLTDRCGVREEAITPGASLRDDLGLDSLDAVELAVAIEDEFDLMILDEDMKKFSTVADAAATIQQLLTEKASGGERPAPALKPAGS